uniref:C-type lectin domain-containing protein n=1 Tax=Panagrolaimus sp. ES5 TaxID=591445 RepID=A0AC34FE61_9BILA
MFFRVIIFACLFSVINASCPKESLEWQKSCYFFKNETIGFAAAEVECVQNGGHLVSIHDSFTDALLAQETSNFFHQSTMVDFWTGLTKMMPSGNWSWIDGTPLDFVDWAKGEPQNITGHNCAAESISDGFWRSDDCFKLKPYVCKADKTFFEPATTTTTKYPVYANCSYPYIYFEPTHSCYGVGNFTGPMNWTQGEQYCQHYGAHLASIHSYDELYYLGSFVYNAHFDFWIGAFSIDGGNSWEWSDRSSWDFNPWSPGWPKMHSNACGLLWSPAIGDQPCDAIRQIICKKPFIIKL